MERFMKPGVAGIIEHEVDGVPCILMQERDKVDAPLEEGLMEIPAGKIREFESIFDCLRREIKEETGLTVTFIEGESDAPMFESNGYRVMSFSPFASTQNLESNYPIMVHTFICQVEGELAVRTDESRNIRWVPTHELDALLESRAEQFYPMHYTTLKRYASIKRGNL